jgi:hypothetical protein
MAEHADDGMRLIDDALDELCALGRITREAAAAQCNDPARFAKALDSLA